MVKVMSLSTNYFRSGMERIPSTGWLAKGTGKISSRDVDPCLWYLWAQTIQQGGNLWTTQNYTNCLRQSKASLHITEIFTCIFCYSFLKESTLYMDQYTMILSWCQCSQTTLSENTRFIQHFKLHDRAQHVFSEAHRVWEFKRICEEECETALSDLGRLMQDSHRSTKLLYECSHPKLDALVELSQGMSLGARLTGAG